jgi:type II secretory pathway predicted ATPase ExeA
MKLHYVQTSNHELFMAGVTLAENGMAQEAKTVLVAGEPGTGKSRTVEHYGANRNAIYIPGMPGMNLPYIRALLADELGINGLKGYALQKNIDSEMARRRQPIILDESQHGLDNKAVVIEYLRRIVEQVGTVLILVCHTSEKHRFAEHKLAHIATRIKTVVDFKPASIADTQLYLKQLCEVSLDGDIARLVHEQSRGRYRLMASAVQTLEALAATKKKDILIEADVKGYLLCEDAMNSLRKRGK